MSNKDDGEDNKDIYIQKRISPAHVPDKSAEQQKEASLGFWRTLWNKLHGHTASDARRLKEAAVDGVEGEAAIRKNKARKLDAEAELIYAQAEEKLRDAALKALEYEKRAAELNGDQIDKDAERMERIANATERVEKAISKIKQMDGDVALDQEQLSRLMGVDEKN